jgi:hypothetical protein
MNIFTIFRTRDIRRQLDNYIDWKRQTKGWGTALTHREWMSRFIAVTKVKDAHELTEYDINYFMDWVVNKYPSDWAKISALNALRCFLRFYKRYDIIMYMTRLGRKPNYEMIGIVKGLRNQNPPVPFRQIVKKLKKEKKINASNETALKQVFRWAKISI